jgi:protein-disulfide isomerase
MGVARPARNEAMNRVAFCSAFAFAFLAVGCGGLAATGRASPSHSPPNGGQPAPHTAADEADASVPVLPNDATWGSRTAPVTIVEFADFECPFCARAEPALTQIREKYGPERLRIVWKNDPLPFHPNARPAAEAAAGVFAFGGRDAFWRFHDLALLGQSSLTEDTFVAWARAAGVGDAEAFRSTLRSHAWAPEVDADVAEAGKLGATGTPWFFVNGVRLIGAQRESALQAVIDVQILAAESKLSSGVSPDRIYGVLAKENFARQSDDDDDSQSDAKTIFKVPIADSPLRGARGAMVTIVEFSDYECPYCRGVEATLQKLRVRYGDKLRLAVKNEPIAFHKHAEAAAEAALEVRAEKGDAGFWAMHDALFEQQADLSGDTLVRLAESAGARPDLVRSAIATHRYAANIDADADLADDLGADGTPQFFIDGRRLAGAQPEEKFAAIIDDEIVKAQALMAAGMKPEALYDALTKDGAGPPELERKELASMPAGDPSRGSADARVVVHEFADFQCPYCVRSEATLRELARNYPGKIRVVWHDLPLPFHENAPVAAQAAREARTQRGDRAFWTLHDQLLVEGAKLSRPDLDVAARALGLDMTKWNASFESAHDGAIDADRNAAAALGLGETPSFVVAAAGATTGYVITGAQSYTKFRKVIERALAEAK